MSMLSTLHELSKKAVFKIAVDLIKADNKIHSQEINVLDRLQKDLQLSQEDIDMVHYMTLEDTIISINLMSDAQTSYLLEMLTDIMKADNDISSKENILLAALKLSCSKDSKGWSKIISVPATEAKIPDTQIVFLEKQRSEAAHAVLDDRFDNMFISKAFNDCGFQFFYLPAVINDLNSKNEFGERVGLLQKSISYLTPSATRDGISNVEGLINRLDTTTFFKVVLSSLHLHPDTFPFDSFILVKIRESLVLDDDNCGKEFIDFLCIDMSEDVKKRVHSFTSLFGEQHFMLPYEGYYKMFYDYLSSESKITSSILIDGEYNFVPENLKQQPIAFKSSPQARTVYLLLMHYGNRGVRTAELNAAVKYLSEAKAEEFTIGGSFDIQFAKSKMKKIDTDWSILIYNTISIYQAISTKDDQSPSYLSYIVSILKHISSLKTYINNGFSQVDGLASPEHYHVAYDKKFKAYLTNASSELFFIIDNGTRKPLTASNFWKELI